MTPEVIVKLQDLLDAGVPTAQAARELNLKPDTVSKAVRAGRLRKKKGQRSPRPASDAVSTKSERSARDSSAPMGMGATDTCGRVLASFGAVVAVKPEFEPAADVPNAGVLAALPALLSCGLLGQSAKYFSCRRATTAWRACSCCSRSWRWRA